MEHTLHSGTPLWQRAAWRPDEVVRAVADAGEEQDGTEGEAERVHGRGQPEDAA